MNMGSRYLITICFVTCYGCTALIPVPHRSYGPCQTVGQTLLREDKEECRRITPDDGVEPCFSLQRLAALQACVAQNGASKTDRMRLDGLRLSLPPHADEIVQRQREEYAEYKPFADLNTIESYRSFIASHPDSGFVVTASRRIDEKRALAARDEEHRKRERTIADDAQARAQDFGSFWRTAFGGPKDEFESTDEFRNRTRLRDADRDYYFFVNGPDNSVSMVYDADRKILTVAIECSLWSGTPRFFMARVVDVRGYGTGETALGVSREIEYSDGTNYILELPFLGTFVGAHGPSVRLEERVRFVDERFVVDVKLEPSVARSFKARGKTVFGVMFSEYPAITNEGSVWHKATVNDPREGRNSAQTIVGTLNSVVLILDGKTLAVVD